MTEVWEKIRDGAYEVTRSEESQEEKDIERKISDQKALIEVAKNNLNLLKEQRNEARYKRLRKENQLQAKAYERFKEDALEELGLTGHPKADALYDKAWQMGHAYGLNEVLGHMRELADLIR